MARTRGHWLLKSEPTAYSIEDLARDGQTFWEGVRNHQARNFLRDAMRKGDLVLFYHSNAKPPGVAGIAKVVSDAYPDATQFDPESRYYDPRASRDQPRWLVVDVAFVACFKHLVPLATLKADAALEGMLVTRRGQRLSVQPVEQRHYARVLELAGHPG